MHLVELRVQEAMAKTMSRIGNEDVDVSAAKDASECIYSINGR